MIERLTVDFLGFAMIRVQEWAHKIFSVLKALVTPPLAMIWPGIPPGKFGDGLNCNRMQRYHGGKCTA